jgi:hypothetical protein
MHFARDRAATPARLKFLKSELAVELSSSGAGPRRLLPPFNAEIVGAFVTS